MSDDVLRSAADPGRLARRALAEARLPAAPEPPPLRTLDTAALLGLAAGPRPALLAPVLPEGGLLVVHGPRGIGRSHLLVGCAAALACGGWFLGWRARRATHVLYVSGAGSAALLGARLAAALRATGARAVAAAGERLALLAPDQQAAPMPALDTAQGQASLVPLLAAADVIVIDDLACLMPGLAGNPARSQARFGELLRRLRHAGKSVLVGQASGAGCSRAERAALTCLEAQADTVISLQRPADYKPADGVRFHLHIERASHLPGIAREAREVRLGTLGGGEMRGNAARALGLARERFHALLAQGLPANEAGRLLGLSRTTAWRWARQSTKQDAGGDAAVSPSQAIEGAQKAPSSSSERDDRDRFHVGHHETIHPLTETRSTVPATRARSP